MKEAGGEASRWGPRHEIERAGTTNKPAWVIGLAWAAKTERGEWRAGGKIEGGWRRSESPR